MREHVKKQETATNPKMYQNEWFLIGIIAIFYTVGTIGLLIEDTREMFIQLSAYNLLLTFTVLAIARKNKRDLFMLFAFLLFFYGLFVEIIGTKTGILFGSYTYGQSLGVKIFGVPVIIGVNWAILVIACSSVVHPLKWKLWQKATLAAAIMTIVDIVVEPVAIDFDYWTWKDGEIPLYNYICWFAVSWPMHYFYMKWTLNERNKVTTAILIIMVLFFIILNLF
jgi:putative membrane protein